MSPGTRNQYPDGHVLYRRLAKGYPKIVRGGVLMSQDGDFPLVIDVFDDDDFWKNVVGCDKPAMQGLRQSKMLTIIKTDGLKR